MRLIQLIFFFLFTGHATYGNLYQQAVPDSTSYTAATEFYESIKNDDGGEVWPEGYANYFQNVIKECERDCSEAQGLERH